MSALRLAPALDAADRRPAAQILRTVAETRAALASHRRAGRRIGLVPTMGALHDGHLSLISAARDRCDVVVVSIFVNPTQFDEQSDLIAYPKQEERDTQLAQDAGADLLFIPSTAEMYKPGFSTSVQVHGLTDTLEGAVRGAGHFRGVTTVVCKLLNIVAPRVAFFGQKDAQQAAVLARMASDLDIDVWIETLPTVRERDGLAMSSRNAHLSSGERARALALVSALRASEALADAGERSGERLLAAAEATLQAWSVEPDYVALVDPESFAAVQHLDRDALLLIAARIGETRLIDNTTLRAARSASGKQGSERVAERSRGPQPPRGGAIPICSA